MSKRRNFMYTNGKAKEMMGINDIKLSEHKSIGFNDPLFIIAEIGQNHQGDINVAKTLIRMAKECGADCVKFQKSCLTEKFTKQALDSPYSSEHSWGRTYGEHKKHLEFSDEQFVELQRYSKDMDIMFSASAMDQVSLNFLNKINVPFIKIGSGDATNPLLLEAAAKTKKPLIISTGMCSLDDVRQIYQIVSKEHKNFALLHCVSSYPTKPCDGNIAAITTLEAEFDVHIGYSGHEIGYNLTLAAASFGAKIIERHITIDKTWKGSDHMCSLEIDEFRSMVTAIREIEEALGAEKVLLPCELPCWQKLGKSIVAKRTIRKGSVIEMEDVGIKVSSPKGMHAKFVKSIVGCVATKHIEEDNPINDDDITQ